MTIDQTDRPMGNVNPAPPKASRASCAPLPTSLRGAEKEQIAVEMATLRAIFWFDDAAWKVAGPAYFEALADIPADLLHDAVRMIIANARTGDRFPRPGDIRDLIRDQFEVRRRAAALPLPAPDHRSSERITAEQAAAILRKHGIAPRKMRPHTVEMPPAPRLTGAQLLARDGYRGVPMASGFTEGV